MRNEGMVPRLLGRHMRRPSVDPIIPAVDILLAEDGTYQSTEWLLSAGIGTAKFGAWWVSGQKLNLISRACFDLQSTPEACSLSNSTLVCSPMVLADLPDTAVASACQQPSVSGVLLAVQDGLLYRGSTYALG